jgi:DNA-binding beta-propeller fold protein YncE
MHASIRLSFVLALFVATFTTPLAAQGKLYFVGNGSGPDPIWRTNVDGSGIDMVVDGLSFPQTIAVDGETGKLYWTNNDDLHRSNLDGSGAELLFSTGGSLRGIALDPEGDSVYVTDTQLQKIWRASLDGSDLVEIVGPAAGLNIPSHIAVDPAGEKIYWTEQNDQQVMRANLDGSGVEELHQSAAYGITLDVPAGHLYWTEQLGGMMRSNLDGSDPVLLFSDFSLVRGLALDPGEGKLYWAGINPTRIRRANLDGSEAETIANYVSCPQGVFLDLSDCETEPDPWTDLGSALAGTTGEPTLIGSGSLVSGCPVSWQLANALPNATALLVLGITAVNAPVKGGVLVPSPASPGAILPLLTNGAGQLDIELFWSAGVPPGIDLFLQYWIIDPGGPSGFAASNAIVRTTL